MLWLMKGWYSEVRWSFTDGLLGLRFRRQFGCTYLQLGLGCLMVTLGHRQPLEDVVEEEPLHGFDVVEVPLLKKTAS